MDREPPFDRGRRGPGPRRQRHPGRAPAVGRDAGGPAGGPPAPRPPAAPTSWDNVASWYDRLVGDEGSDYHRQVILPAALRMLAPEPHERVLDLCCGQGVFCRLLAQHGVDKVVGVDASGELIAAARQRGPSGVRYLVADATRLGPDVADGSFDAAACLMAVQDVDDLDGLFGSLGRALRPGGRAVIIMMHPCFRIPRQSSWGWDDEKGTQYRRLDRYAGAMTIPIATHPGGPGGPGGGTSGAGGAAGGTDGSGGAAGAGGSGGAGGQYTQFFHRPLAEYLSALGRASLAVVAAEELLTHRQSEPGGHSRGENRAKAEFPIFLALKAVRLG